MSETAHPTITLTKKGSGEPVINVLDITPIWAYRCEGYVPRFTVTTFYCVDVDTARTRPDTRWGESTRYGIKTDEMAAVIEDLLQWRHDAAITWVMTLGVLAQQYADRARVKT